MRTRGSLGRQRATDSGDEGTYARAHRAAAMLADLRGDFQGQRHHFAVAVDLSRPTLDGAAMTSAMANLAVALQRVGTWADGRTPFD